MGPIFYIFSALAFVIPLFPDSLSPSLDTPISFLFLLIKILCVFFPKTLFTVYSPKAVVLMLGASTILKYVPRAF